MAFSDSFANAYSAVSNARQRRSELEFEKKKRDQELKLKGYDPETLDIIPGSDADVQKAQNNQTLQLAKGLESKLAAQDTDNAVLDFADTGDATYLQKALDSNPTVKQAWSARGVQQVGNLDWQNDESLLKRSGFNSSEYDTLEKQAIMRKNIYKFYDGSKWEIGLLNKAVAETGVLSRVGTNRGQKITDNFQQFRDFMAGPRSSANTVEGHKFEQDINAASEETGVPANLIASLLNTGDVMASKDVIKDDSKRLASLLTKYNGDTRLALAALKSSPEEVDKYNGVPPQHEVQQFVNKALSNYAAGESYYSTNEVINEGQQLGSNPTVTDINNLTKTQSTRADNRIATIQNFVRSNANAAKGTTNENVDAVTAQNNRTLDLTEAKNKTDAQLKARELDIEEKKIRATLQANAVKLATDRPTTTQKNLAAAENETIDLLNKFGGEEAFLSTDFSDTKNYNKAWQNVVKINKLEGTELTQKDKENITGIRELIALADPAAKISGEQTGIIDKNLKSLSKYLSDNVTGVERTAAMASFRNTLRHALYGSALTDGEIKAFNEAFGENSQKLGPVLHQFKVAVNQVQAKLDSISTLGNPYTMKVMIGADADKLNRVRAALQQRIDYIEGRYTPKSETPGNTADKPSLDTIFGGAD